MSCGNSYTMYDCIVIGAGIVGSATAYHLSKSGRKVLLLEQFGLPHTRGSSHGPTRILRRTYSVPLYTKLTDDAIPLWHQLEKETGTKLLLETPLLMVEKYPHEVLNKRVEEVQKTSDVKVDLRGISAEEIKRQYSGLLRLDPDVKGYVEIKAFRIMADKALVCFRSQIRQFGGTIKDEEKVLDIVPGTTVTVKTTKGSYRARSIVITPGTWINKILKPLGLDVPVEVWKPIVCYWAEKVPGSYKNMPSFLDLTRKQFYVYALRSSEYNGLIKVSIHQGPIVDPDYRDAHFMEPRKDIDFLCDYIREHFPGLHDKPRIMEPCIYSITPDEEYIIDTLPHHPNVVYACGMSGHGFKTAPILGKILTDMALGRQPDYDISRLKLGRFLQTPGHKSKL